jgi:hypothetical protein
MPSIATLTTAFFPPQKSEQIRFQPHEEEVPLVNAAKPNPCGESEVLHRHSVEQ